MPAKFFECTDKEKIKITDCLKPRGCRLDNRCAPTPYLKAASFDREWRGVSPSSAASDARLLWLKAIKPYVINPASRAYALLGTAVHGKLSIYDYNVLAEETLSDEQMKGTADLLEKDENNEGFILTDYKTFGSYKVMKCLGIASKTVKVLDSEGNQVLFKSGRRKGVGKTRKEIEIKPENIDIENESLQLNRYRIFFEKNGFPISKIQLFVIVRDGNTMAARTRMVDKNTYIVPVPKMPDIEVLNFYNELDEKVKLAFKEGYAPKCSDKLCWDGRRCQGFCEVSDYCRAMGE